MSHTIWVYDADLQAMHHSNNLNEDTFEDLPTAISIARKRTLDTPHNTGYSKVIDNSLAGKMGDRGVIAMFKKDVNGRVHSFDVRSGYENTVRLARIHKATPSH